MRSGCVCRVLVVTAMAAMAAAPLAAQKNVTPPKATIRVFFDCPQYGACNGSTAFDFFRRQIPYVNWVRDRTEADVHVLITQQTTGGGGEQYRVAFIGLGVFEGQADSLVVNMPATATMDEQRRAIAEKMKLGLVRYLAQTEAAQQLRVSYGSPGGAGRPGGPPSGAARSPATSARKDPWNYWVFKVSGSTFLEGESSIKYGSYYGAVTANRTTNAWKVNLGFDYSLDTRKFILTDSTYSVREHAWEVNGSLVRSVRSQWAVGVRTGLGASDSYNETLAWSVQPGVEYDVFPYAQSSRRSLAFQYVVGPHHWRYKQRTIYEKDAETRLQGSARADLSLIQPWGQWSTSLTWTHLLPETNRYHLTLNGYLQVRVFKGLSVTANAYYSWVHDQIYLSAQGVTDEEILLHLRQLYTTFSYFASIGLSYRFGSIFNNVVNPRFGGSSIVY